MKKIIISALFVLTIFTSNFASTVCGNRYTEIVPIVEAMGFRVTSTTGGRHNKNSKHKLGLAVDVSVRGKTDFHVNMLIEVLTNAGYIVLDERVRPPKQKVWSGPHMHIHSAICGVLPKK